MPPRRTPLPKQPSWKPHATPGQRHRPLLLTDYSPADSKDFVANLRRLRLIARAYNSPELQAFLASWPARIEKEPS